MIQFEPIRSQLQAFARRALPQTCTLCAAPAGDALVCHDCAASLPRLERTCAVCAIPIPHTPKTGPEISAAANATLLHGSRADPAVCGACLAHPPPFSATLAPYAYAFPVDRLLQQLKYRGQLVLADWAADALATTVATAFSRHPDGERPDAVVALPLAPARQRERGFNQAREIAVRVARRVAIRLEHPLERRRHAAPQAVLPWAQRRKNVRGAFAIASGADVRSRSFAVVDDVMTTGATLAEAAAVLRRAGAARVECWVVARTPAPES